jgi:zinc protease
MSHPLRLFLLAFPLLLLASCSEPTPSPQSQDDFRVNFEKFTLDNGLDVIFHEDHSDPVAAVALTFHVGSAREKEGKTGFAHLFEHLLFLESENLGKGGLDKLNARVGGSGANGSTSRDRTNYFQTVPSDALEKMLWAEADKLGFFINTVTEAVVAKEKQVVKNEKRQSVDNRPYGHASYVIGKNMYPEDHPYNWQVIGSLEDLQNATLADVKEFYNKWYVPNNCTLVVAGDFDPEQAREWVEKYFAEIKRGGEIVPMEKRRAELSESKMLYHEDNFARLPELRMAWPSVETYHPDAYPLEILASLLTEGKKAPFQKVIVEEKQLSSNVSASSRNSELAGEFYLTVQAFPNTDLDEIYAGIQEAFTRFETEGFTEADLNRIKAGQETSFYSGLSSVLGKAFQLAQYNIFAGDPSYINEDIKRVMAVTPSDVKRVYEKYIKDQPFVATSFVPQGQAELVLEGSEKAEVAEEKIVQGRADEAFTLPESVEYERTPSSFDRTVEPPYGPSPEIKVPELWKGALSNGIQVYGIENKELPLVQFNLRLKGGLLLDQPDKVGVANLVATLMTKGTQNKTPEELEAAIDELGARISIRTGQQEIIISGNSLSRNYAQTMALVQEMLLEPRWDEEEFKLAKQSVMSRITASRARPNMIAANSFNEILYGKDHILSNNILGTQVSVESISLQDLKDYYSASFSPSVANYLVVGDVSEKEVMEALSGLEDNWAKKEVQLPNLPEPPVVDNSKVYFYDVPNAKQSVLRFGYLALAENDPDYYPAEVMNYILGGGGFASRLTQELREGKGYTYGIGSSFFGSELPGPFTISSGVRTNVTYESAQTVKDILADYPTTFTEKDLETTKSSLTKSQARAFETLGAKLNMLDDISSYGWSADYVKKRKEIIENMTMDRIQELAEKYANPDKMIYLVVGDAATQKDRLKQLGYGEPILLNAPVE